MCQKQVKRKMESPTKEVIIQFPLTLRLLSYSSSVIMESKSADLIDQNGVKITPSQIEGGDNNAYDAVFGEITEDGPNYRNVSVPVMEWLAYKA